MRSERILETRVSTIARCSTTFAADHRSGAGGRSRRSGGTDSNADFNTERCSSRYASNSRVMECIPASYTTHEDSTDLWKAQIAWKTLRLKVNPRLLLTGPRPGASFGYGLSSARNRSVADQPGCI